MADMVALPLDSRQANIAMALLDGDAVVVRYEAAVTRQLAA
jgi:hypothetical protein